MGRIAFSLFFDIVQGEEPPDTGGGPGRSSPSMPLLVFWPLLAVSASTLALVFGSALCSCGVNSSGELYVVWHER